MRKAQLEDMQMTLFEYVERIKKIELDFQDDVNKIPYDLPSYAHISRIQIASDYMFHKKEEELKNLYEELSKVEIKHTLNDILLFTLIFTLIGVALMMIIFLFLI